MAGHAKTAACLTTLRTPLANASTRPPRIPRNNYLLTVRARHDSKPTVASEGRSMNLQNRPPVFVPREHWDEIEKLSKAALMDLVWDYAAQVAGVGDSQAVMTEFRSRRETILTYR